MNILQVSNPKVKNFIFLVPKERSNFQYLPIDLSDEFEKNNTSLKDIKLFRPIDDLKNKTGFDFFCCSSNANNRFTIRKSKIEDTDEILPMITNVTFDFN